MPLTSAICGQKFIPVELSSAGFHGLLSQHRLLVDFLPRIYISRLAQLPASHPSDCLIRLDVSELIMTTAAVLQSGGNDPLIAFLLTCVCYFGAVLALQTISKKQCVCCRLISAECGSVIVCQFGSGSF